MQAPRRSFICEKKRTWQVSQPPPPPPVPTIQGTRVLEPQGPIIYGTPGGLGYGSMALNSSPGACANRMPYTKVSMEPV